MALMTSADDGTLPAAPLLDDSRPTCEFGNTAHNPNDAPFTCNNKLIGARQMIDTYRALIGATPDEFDSARDDNGHGTHTASTAAGNLLCLAAGCHLPTNPLAPRPPPQPLAQAAEGASVAEAASTVPVYSSQFNPGLARQNRSGRSGGGW